MIAEGATNSTANAAESMLRAELARGESALRSIDPVLRHLVCNDDQSIFSEEIIARTRGMIGALATHMLHEVWAAGRRHASRREDEARLSAALLAQPVLLGHCHALALEGQLAERLAAQARLDPALSPLTEALLAAPDAEVAGLAMKVLTAQTRFMQGQRRMDITPDELPADLLHDALIALEDIGGAEVSPNAAAIRARYDEARSRMGLLTRLVLGLGRDHAQALALGEAGLGTFTSALSLAAMQDRAQVVLAMTDGQQARLATMLAAAGLPAAQIEATLALVHPDIAPARHYLGLDRGHAAALLASGGQA